MRACVGLGEHVSSVYVCSMFHALWWVPRVQSVHVGALQPVGQLDNQVHLGGGVLYSRSTSNKIVVLTVVVIVLAAHGV
jgi:hypothetical protein